VGKKMPRFFKKVAIVTCVLIIQLITNFVLASGSCPVDSPPQASVVIETHDYKLPPRIDSEVLPKWPVELWARTYHPKLTPDSGLLPVILILHGNHSTCGKGVAPRVDNSALYTYEGRCPPGFDVVLNHLGYAYLAERLAGLGYFVVSINVNRGINAGQSMPDDNGLNLARGKIILRHFELLSRWNRLGGSVPYLGIDLKGHLDFSQVGLIGHSRGGEGIRAAYNLYRDAASPWPTRIVDPLLIKAMFEIGPVDGQTGRVLNADGVAWNVLLPMCDGDVSNLSGIKAFDRNLNISDAHPKSIFAVWGANHNFYNTEWQQSDSFGCQFQTPLFHIEEQGSASQRETALFAVTEFFSAHLPTGNSISNSARYFDSLCELPYNLNNITRVDRTYLSSTEQNHFAVIDNFSGVAPATSAGATRTLLNGLIEATEKLPEQDTSVTVARYRWTGATAKTPPTVELALPTQLTDSISAMIEPVLFLRLARVVSALNTPPSYTDFSFRLKYDDDSLSTAVPLSRYFILSGPVGNYFDLHQVLASVRVPLADFGNSLKPIKGVQFVFDRTSMGEIYISELAVNATSPAPVAMTKALNFSNSAPISNDVSFSAKINIRTPVKRWKALTRNEKFGSKNLRIVEVWPENIKFLDQALVGLPRLKAGSKIFTHASFPTTGEMDRLWFYVDSKDLSLFVNKSLELIE
jgi:hypothetical protein